MDGRELNSEQIAALAVLADGIIPPDVSDAGAGAVNVAERLAEKIAAGVNSSIYLAGLERAQGIARERFSATVSALTAAQVHELLGVLREVLPGFFKQL